MKSFNRSKLLIILLIIAVPSIGFAGTAYYVDPRVWAMATDLTIVRGIVSHINAHRFSTGDDLYFRAGTILKMTAKLTIDWDGSATDRATIGAYYGKNKFGLGDNARPVLDANNSVPTGDYEALIEYERTGGYVTIQDLQLNDSYSKGISMSYKYTPERYFTQHNIVRNCYIKNAGRQGIVFARASNGLIENTIVEGASSRRIMLASGNYAYGGAAIEITGMNNEDVTRNNTVRGCTLFNNFETLGIYKGAINTTVENNTIYNFVQVGIYVANARKAIIRNNIVYEPETSFWPGDGRDPLIWIDSEGHVTNIIKVTGECEIYGNFLAGGSSGVFLLSNSNDIGVYQSGNVIYNNRIIDCTENFRFHKTDPQWSGNQIYGNYSFVTTEGFVQSNSYSPPGVTWTGNYFNSSVSGNAAINSHINKVFLSKETGWRSLPEGGVNASIFKFTNENGAALAQPGMITPAIVSNVRLNIEPSLN